MTYVQTVEVPAGSVEFVSLEVTADVNLTMAVELSLTPNTTPTVHSWQPAGWVGDVSKTRKAQTTAPVTHMAGMYKVHARLTDSPELPIIASQNTVVVT